MIRRVHHSPKALAVAKEAFLLFVRHEDAFRGKDSVELSSLPLFTLRLSDAAARNWNKAIRLGWSYCCLPTQIDAGEEETGAIITVRRARWAKPRFAGYSCGRKAVRHCTVAKDAQRWADAQNEIYSARILSIPPLHLELLWLKPRTASGKHRFLPLSTRQLRSDHVENFLASAAQEKIGAWRTQSQSVQIE